MQKILLLLNEHPLVERYAYNSPPDRIDLQLYELTIYFINKSELHVREIHTATQRKYSYHWQTAKKELIVRWDTSEHFPDLSTFPHHKHNPKPNPSEEISLDDVLNYIFSTIDQ